MKPHNFPSVPSDARSVPVNAKDEPLYRCSGNGGHFVPRSGFHVNRANPRGFHYVCIKCAQDARGTKKPRLAKREPNKDDQMPCALCGKMKVSSHFRQLKDRRWYPYCRTCDSARKNEEHSLRWKLSPSYREKRRKLRRRADAKRIKRRQAKRKELRREFVNLAAILSREHGYSRKKLAAIAGIHHATLARWTNEDDTRIPDLPPIERGVKALTNELFNVLDSR